MLFPPPDAGAAASPKAGASEAIYLGRKTFKPEDAWREDRVLAAFHLSHD